MTRSRASANGLTPEQIQQNEVLAPEGATPEETAHAKAVFAETINKLLKARTRRSAVTQKVILDWNHSTHWNHGRQEPCVHCRKPALLDGTNRPAHKTCTEAAV
jgi:hypothetical protein